MSTSASTLAFVESPVQLLNTLEWAYARGTTADRPLDGVPSQRGRRAAGRAAEPGPRPADTLAPLRIVVLPPTDPMSRGQLRRMAALARDEGCDVQWQEARGSRLAPLRALAALAGDVRAARTVVIGDPFSRYVQLLLTL
ncbi:hypothetical protein ACWGQT_12575, partial [Streptomyces yangpuensis]